MEKYQSYFDNELLEAENKVPHQTRKFFLKKPEGVEAAGWKFTPGKGRDPDNPKKLIQGFWGIKIKKTTGKKKKTASQKRAIGRAIKMAARKRTASQKKRIAKKIKQTRKANR